MSFLRPSCFHPVPAQSGRRWLVASALLFALAARVSAAEPIKTYTTLALKDGRVLSEVQVINYTATDVLVRHVGGATSLSSEILPESVLTDLHLPIPVATPTIDPAFLALADKIAVVDAPAAATPGRPFARIEVASADSSSNVSAQQLQAASSYTVTTAAPAGEGNFVEALPLTAPVVPTAAAPHRTWTTVPGRVAVTPVAGDTRFLRGVEVRAYPADLLARYVEQARASADLQAQPFREQAAALAQEGRTEESNLAAARAARLAENYLDLIPVAPFTARSDDFGHFTLRHDLRDARLVAIGRITTAQGEWTYAWIGLAPGDEPVLTEANATAITAPAAAGVSFAAR